MTLEKFMNNLEDSYVLKSVNFLDWRKTTHETYVRDIETNIFISPWDLKRKRKK